jgi:hypothetical protein
LAGPHQQGDAVHEAGDHDVGYEPDVASQSQHAHQQQQAGHEQQRQVDELVRIGAGGDVWQALEGHADDNGGNDAHRRRGARTLDSRAAENGGDQGDDPGREHAGGGAAPGQYPEGGTKAQSDEAYGKPDEDVMPDRRRAYPGIRHRPSMRAAPTVVKHT